MHNSRRRYGVRPGDRISYGGRALSQEPSPSPCLETPHVGVVCRSPPCSAIGVGATGEATMIASLHRASPGVLRCLIGRVWYVRFPPLELGLLGQSFIECPGVLYILHLFVRLITSKLTNYD